MAIVFDDNEIRRGLLRLAQAGEDLRPVMQKIAAALEAGVDRAFEKETAPDGTPWPNLSKVTRERRRKQGTWPGQILNITGASGLSGSITTASDALTAQAGTIIDHAPTQQYGARKGQYDKTRRGGPIPWGDIPARPFLGVSDETREEILDLLRKYFLRALG